MRALYALLAGAALVSLGVLVWSLGRPLADLHGFRQTQTAISVYWMLHGGPWLDYWTPVLGAPWAAPFEFPLYQWIVAALCLATGTPIDPAGRLVSYAWLLAAAWPARGLCRDLALPRATWLFFCVLMLLAPTYLFWGRSFLIETQALTLSLFFVWLGRRAVLADSTRAIPFAAAAGALAALTKITTLFPFAAALALLILADWRRTLDFRRALGHGWRGAAVLLPGVVLFAAWNAHADALKSLNPLAALLRSDAPQLVAWNFGTLSQRVSPDMAAANLRALSDALGLFALPLLVALGWAAARAKTPLGTLRLIAGLLACYFLPWAVLTNLHVVHDYYQTATALFLIAAAAVALGAVWEGGRPGLALLLCSALAVSQLGRFAAYHAEAIRVQPDGGRDLALARLVRRGTGPGEVLLAYGLDWSSLVPYYAERRARMEPSWTGPADYRSRLPRWGRIGSSPIAAVIRCPSQLDGDSAAEASFVALGRSARTRRVGNCLVYFRPSRAAA